MFDLIFIAAWFAKVFALYGMLLMHVIFLFAAGLLFAHYKNAYSGMFFFGLFANVSASTVIRLIFEFRGTERLETMQSSIQLFSIISTIGYFVQVIGFLLFVFHFIENKINK